MKISRLLHRPLLLFIADDGDEQAVFYEFFKSSSETSLFLIAINFKKKFIIKFMILNWKRQKTEFERNLIFDNLRIRTFIL